MKRKRPEDPLEAASSSNKRVRIGPRRSLLHLSDEILIKILSFLSVPRLVTVERVSRRFRQLAIDSELWKSRFYDTWIRARAKRIPHVSRKRYEELSYSMKLTRWLEHGQCLRDNMKVDWKRQYKIRSNWTSGAAKVQEVEIAKPPVPPVLAKVHKGMIFTVDPVAGLRAWTQKQGSKQLISQSSINRGLNPTSIAVDGLDSTWRVAVGYDRGNFGVYTFSRSSGFELVEEIYAAENESVTSMALSSPYLLVTIAAKDLKLYEIADNKSDSRIRSPVPIAVLHSDVAFQPCSLDLRIVQESVIATVAYAFSTIQAGWCIGLQEIRVSKRGDFQGSRLVSTIDTPCEVLYRGQQKWEFSSRSTSSAPFVLHPQLMSAPTSLSYAHPFLIASLPDNTIMSYIVTSDHQKLEINSGRRLWGHTSAVSGAEVSNRGKAVSVTVRGNDMRVWELEEFLTTINPRGWSTQIKLDKPVEMSEALTRRGNGLGLALPDMRKELALTRRWVGFDEEQVVVLGERDTKQIMACYDFT